MPARDVTVLILAPAPDPGAGPLASLLDAARTALGARLATLFLAAGATEAVVHREPPDATPFGTRLARIVEARWPAGLVVLGAGALPTAGVDDVRPFVTTAGGDHPAVLANNAYSADVVAIARPTDVLRDLPPDLSSDNALPRWLAEVGGIEVQDLRERRDLALDVDSPLDLVLLEAVLTAAEPPVPQPEPEDAGVVRNRLDQLRALAADPAAEVLVAGRVGARDVAAIEQRSRARTRAIIEERGLRTASLAAARGTPNRRPPRSVLGRLLEPGGARTIGRVVADLADCALVDSRVLLAARLGADERGWPDPEDRYASDLLLPDRISDPWLRELTAGAAEAPVPVLLGGHTLVGPGSVLALGLPGGPAGRATSTGLA